MRLSQDDERMLDRLLDGELDASAASALQARIDAEPSLRSAFEGRQCVRAAFAAARGVQVAAPAGFTANVLAATRRLPTRGELEQADVGESIVRLCQRILLAAVVVVGLGWALYGGLLDRTFSSSGSTLEAAPDDVQREMDRLDALIQSGAVDERKAK